MIDAIVIACLLLVAFALFGLTRAVSDLAEIVRFLLIGARKKD
jgi:hypothetical protein